MKDARVLLEFILECADLIAEYLDGVTFDEFEESHLAQDAVFRRLAVLGQAVKDLPDAVRSRYSEVPWRQIAGMRDKLSHDYLGIDLEVTWYAATRDLPRLRAQVETMLRELREGDFS